MAKLVDPRDNKYEYQSPIERYGCPLEKDAKRKRPPSHEFQMRTDVLCSPPTLGTRQAVFSLKLDNPVKIDEKGAKYDWGIALTPHPLVDISIERTAEKPHFMLMCRDREGNVGELKFAEGMMVQLDASQAKTILEAKARREKEARIALIPPDGERIDDLGVFVAGPGIYRKGIIGAAYFFEDCERYSKDRNVRFFLAEADAFNCEEIKWIAIKGPDGAQQPLI